MSPCRDVPRPTKNPSRHPTRAGAAGAAGASAAGAAAGAVGADTGADVDAAATGVLATTGVSCDVAGADTPSWPADPATADPAFASLTDAAAWLRTHLPPLSLTTDAQWLRMAELTYAQGQVGRFHPTWDTRIARLLDRPTPDLWPLFGALAHVPLLLVHGQVSTVLLPETVRRMQTLRPDMTVVSLPGIGHAPTLSEPSVMEKIVALLKAVG